MFDPTLPLENTEIDAVQMRSQLTGLKALIDAILSVTNAQIDGVTTLNPGDAASVGVSVTGNTLHFTFGIPRGNDGIQGLPGAIQQSDLDNLSNNLTTAFTDSDANLQNNLNSAIAGTAVNPAAVATLDQPFGSDPPTQTDIQTLCAKINELITALKR